MRIASVRWLQPSSVCCVLPALPCTLLRAPSFASFVSPAVLERGTVVPSCSALPNRWLPCRCRVQDQNVTRTTLEIDRGPAWCWHLILTPSFARFCLALPSADNAGLESDLAAPAPSGGAVLKAKAFGQERESGRNVALQLHRPKASRISGPPAEIADCSPCCVRVAPIPSRVCLFSWFHGRRQFSQAWHQSRHREGW